jgi:hypothetical protein
VKKAESESFDAHDVETTERTSYTRPRPDAGRRAEDTKRTAKIPKVDLETILRTESGTQRAISPDAITRHVEEKTLENHLRAQMEDAFAVVIDQNAAGEEQPLDPHSRPTMEAVPKALSVGTAPVPAVAWPPLAEPTPPAPATPAALPPRVALAPRPVAAVVRAPSATPSIPRWVIPAMVFSLVVLLSTAGSIGFFLGRLTGHH